ncbi:sulfatase family protein [Novosphingobium pentaromativorans]|uniref:Sulfatase n=1 Tax=Novosphingobium pentaromativorans US6-1 TaxID=1088721 RepID=G6EGK9_9SPHN|nr:sulfatase [Novosphingobium pentaromativorans]AIT82163.1 acetylglucosamine-6-sulfatase [Novosphingobium pentaromativorans US6-1]EHJ59556.1 sulfatase [Novosphingobium pentaromativorans US6-1]
MNRSGNLLKRIALAGCAAFATLPLASTALTAREAPVASTATHEATHPNMIFVLVDDLRFDAMGFLTPGLKTPNIDYLAKHGTYFPNAVVTSSLCSPSRATILTGQTARNHRVIDNNNSSEEGLIFFPSYLQKAGYQTSFFGKWHMGNDTDAPRPGFNRWVSFKGQGTYLPTDQLSPAQIAAGQRQMLNVDGTEVKRKGYITDELTDYAMDWLENGRDKSKPFFLYLSHKAVHSDTVPAKRHEHQYDDLPIELPDTMADTPENRKGKPVWVQNQRNSWHGADFPYHTNVDLTEVVRSYYETLSSVDDSLGRILKYLRSNKLDKKTMIVFYSDNGFLFGDHGLIDKRNAYEPSVRVPMVVWAPGLVPQDVTNPALVRNLDLAPTFLDLAGVDKPGQMEGSSFLSLAEGKTAPSEWKPGDFVYEYYWEWSFPQTPTTFAIERNRIKYIQYHGVWDIEELYDLGKDPEEKVNLINDPDYLDEKVALRNALFDELANGKGDHVVPYTRKTSAGIVNRDINGTRAADFPPDWYVKPNLPSRMNGLFPDTEEKLEADKAGRPYFPKGAH